MAALKALCTAENFLFRNLSGAGRAKFNVARQQLSKVGMQTVALISLINDSVERRWLQNNWARLKGHDIMMVVSLCGHTC